VIAVAFFIVLSATDRIIAGTRFMHLPEGSRHRRSKVSLAMHNPLVVGHRNSRAVNEAARRLRQNTNSFLRKPIGL
jgi:hypothetical protein